MSSGHINNIRGQYSIVYLSSCEPHQKNWLIKTDRANVCGMQCLEIFQSLWAMEQLRPDGFEWPLAEKMSKIADAGFDGVDIVYGDFDSADIQPFLRKHGLACTVTVFPDSVEAIKPAIDFAKSLDARQVNIIGKVYPFGIAEGADYVRGWMELCRQADLSMTIETHRDCLTTDLHYSLQLMNAVPEIPLCADLSHFVVGREFSWPITDLVQSQIKTILDCSIAFQGRIASREQIQLQISFEHHREWYDLFAEWWRYGFESWKARAADDAILNFLCELGPKEYAMTGPDGYELSDRWEEALMIKQRVREIWNSL